MIKNWRYWPIIRRFLWDKYDPRFYGTLPAAPDGVGVITFTVGGPDHLPAGAGGTETVQNLAPGERFSDGTEPQIIRGGDSWHIEVWGGSSSKSGH